MQDLRWLMRMSNWARRPPSLRRVQLFFAVAALCLALYAFDRLFGWPDWLIPDYTPRGRVSR